MLRVSLYGGPMERKMDTDSSASDESSMDEQQRARDATGNGEVTVPRGTFLKIKENDDCQREVNFDKREASLSDEITDQKTKLLLPMENNISHFNAASARAMEEVVSGKSFPQAQQNDGNFLGEKVTSADSDQAELRASVATSHEGHVHEEVDPESYWKEVSGSYTPKQERFLELLEMTQGKGLMQGEFSPGGYSIKHFPAQEFFKLASQFLTDRGERKFVQKCNRVDIIGALDVAISSLKKELQARSAALSEQIKIVEANANLPGKIKTVEENIINAPDDVVLHFFEQQLVDLKERLKTVEANQTNAPDDELYFLEQQLEFLKEQITTVEKQHAVPIAGNVYDDEMQPDLSPQAREDLEKNKLLQIVENINQSLIFFDKR